MTLVYIHVAMNCVAISTLRGNVSCDNNEIALTADLLHCTEYTIHCSHAAREYLIEQNLLCREKLQFRFAVGIL